MTLHLSSPKRQPELLLISDKSIGEAASLVLETIVTCLPSSSTERIIAHHLHTDLVALMSLQGNQNCLNGMSAL